MAWAPQHRKSARVTHPRARLLTLLASSPNAVGENSLTLMPPNVSRADEPRPAHARRAPICHAAIAEKSSSTWTKEVFDPRSGQRSIG
jgi:hypothetical protein